MKRIAVCFLILSVLSGPALGAGPSISARGAVLVDGDSGRVLWSYNGEQSMPIASTTKLMTALVAYQYDPTLQSVVEIDPDWTGIEGSSLYLRAGERLTLEELLYGLLLVSGNDAAEAIAASCGGDRADFLERMNQTAAELGMTNSHFSTPSGLEDEGNYASAADLAKLARAFLAVEPLAAIASTPSATIGQCTLLNHNKLLWRYEGCIGLKTGYTQLAGRTLVSAAERNGQTLIAVTLNDRNDWADHAELLDYGFSAFPRTVLMEAGTVLATRPVSRTLPGLVTVTAKETVGCALAPGETAGCQMELPAVLQAPLEAGEEVGRLTFTLNGQVVGETPLIVEYGVASLEAGDRSLLDWLRVLWLGMD